MNKCIVLGLLGLLTTTLANAQSSGFYIGASYLNAETELLRETDNDSGFEARLGYSLDEHFSVEANYLDLGSINLPEFQDAGGSADTDGFAVTALGIYPMGRIHLIGKIGYLWLETEGQLGSIAGPINYSSDESELMFGAGLSYNITDRIEVKLEYNESQHFNWSSLGINYRF
ncbi:MAG: porin family protein [Pseudohongiella sp.]|nr:porin family protein [Pseudohongiella sp.]